MVTSKIQLAVWLSVVENPWAFEQELEPDTTVQAEPAPDSRLEKVKFVVNLATTFPDRADPNADAEAIAEFEKSLP